MKAVLAVAVALTLGGCGGVNYVVDNYMGVTPIWVGTGDDTYRVYEHPRTNSVMITPSLAVSGGQGFVQGLTLGAVAPRAPKPLFERAVRVYLDGTSRKHCQIGDGYVVLDPQWEFRFSCSPAKGEKEPFTPFAGGGDETAGRS